MTEKDVADRRAHERLVRLIVIASERRAKMDAQKREGRPA